MDFETLGMIAVVWVVVSIAVSPLLGLFLRESRPAAVTKGSKRKLAQPE